MKTNLTLAQPGNVYALGDFCAIVHLYAIGVPHSKIGFMKDFFDQVLVPDHSFEEMAKRRPRSGNKIGKHMMQAGPWTGINETDLVKFFNGSRKLPSWKAKDFYRCLDISRVEEMFKDISIDALGDLQRQLISAGIRADDISSIPTVLGNWLLQILKANANDRDIKVDGPITQPELDLEMNLPLSEGRIAGGKLLLGRSSVAWPKYPSPPVIPLASLEQKYLEQILAAFAEHYNKPIHDRIDLTTRDQQEYEEQRGFFYDAEGFRRNMRDVVDGGEQEFNAMKDDLYNGVCDTCRSNHDDGLMRMRDTLRCAAVFPLSASVLTRFPALIKAAEKKGICHMLVNDQKLEWVIIDEQHRAV